jgi:23S rRNA pseudouridine2605 synthase
MRRLAEGTVVEGVAVAPDAVILEGMEQGYGIVRIDLREGKKREVRVLAANADLDVHQLLRISFGPIRLGTLKRGAVRPLTAAELAALRKAAVPRGARLSRGRPR